MFMTLEGLSKLKRSWWRKITASKAITCITIYRRVRGKRGYLVEALKKMLSRRCVEKDAISLTS